MAIVRKSAIPAITGQTQELQAILAPIKEAIETITGARSGVDPIRKLQTPKSSVDAPIVGTADLVSKVNEIVVRLNVTGAADTDSTVAGDHVPATGTATTRPIPVGGIIIWSGALAAIPSGWALCDGIDGRPDLRNRFVYGAHGSGSPAVDTTGGSADAIAVAHTHGVSITSSDISTNHTHAFTTGTESANHTHAMYGGGTGRTLIVSVAGGANLQSTAGGSTHDATNTGIETAAHAHSGTTGTVSSGHSHGVNGNTAPTGSSGTAANLPPYYVLAYIICVA